MPALLQSTPVVAVIGVAMYAATTLALFKPQKLVMEAAQHSATEEMAHTGPLKTLWDYKNPEVDTLVEELRKEKQNLGLREQQLTELEARLKSERLELNQLTQAVHQMQMEISSSITRIQEEEAPNIKKLSKIYAAMSPEGAAVILAKMTDEQVVKILALMKDDEKAPLLEELSKTGPEAPQRAALLTDRLRLTLTKPAAPGSK